MAIVAATGRSGRRGDCHGDRPVYTLQAIVAATIAGWLLDETGVRRRDDRSDNRGDDRPVYTPY